jgi:hypothetical protein
MKYAVKKNGYLQTKWGQNTLDPTIQPDFHISMSTSFVRKTILRVLFYKDHFMHCNKILKAYFPHKFLEEKITLSSNVN